MKATGIVRRIDDIGRVIIPKELRDAMRFEPGDQVEIFVDDDAIVYRKYKAAEIALEEIALDLLADLEESVSGLDDFERKEIERHIRRIEMFLNQDKAPDAAATAIERKGK